MIYVANSVGNNKIESEDTILVGNSLISGSCTTLPIPSEGFICVADGVGGNNGGKEASTYVLDGLSSLSAKFDDIANAIAEINARLIDLSTNNPDLSGMATTLTGIHIKSEGIKLIHIGNSRAYIMQGRYLKQITYDHTTYNWLRCVGRFEEAEACNKSEIIGCLGGSNVKLASKLLISELKEFGTMLLTTDGIHEFVSIDDLEAILSSNSDGIDKCNAIIDAAKSAGSLDDLSVVIICLQEG